VLGLKIIPAESRSFDFAESIGGGFIKNRSWKIGDLAEFAKSPPVSLMWGSDRTDLFEVSKPWGLFLNQMLRELKND
jgi:hypothetical protein